MLLALRLAETSCASCSRSPREPSMTSRISSLEAPSSPLVRLAGLPKDLHKGTPAARVRDALCRWNLSTHGA